jgi:hypothetical protein
VPNYYKKEKFILDSSNFDISETNFSSKTADEMVKIFEDFTHYCAKVNANISDERFDLIVMNVIEKLKDMRDVEIIKVLVDMQRIPVGNIRDRNFLQLWNALDDECWTRSRNWHSIDMLKVLNAFFQLGIVKPSNYNHKALLKICRKIEELKPRIFVEMMFYQSQVRSKEVPMYNAEARFMKIFNEFNIDEIGIICLAYFKTETKLKDNLLISKIYKKVKTRNFIANL